MSLLNDALRKHRQEHQGAQKRPFSLPAAAARRRPRPIWLLAVVLTAAGLLFPLWQATGTREAPDRPPLGTSAIVPSAVSSANPGAVEKTPSDPKPPPAATASPTPLTTALALPPATAVETESATPPAATPQPPPVTGNPKTAAAPAAKRAAPPPPPAAPTGDTPFYQKALALHRQQRFTEAIGFYRQVLEQHPDHAACRFNLAAAYLDSGVFSDAYPLLKTLAATAPQKPEIRLNLAIAEIGMGRMEAAAANLDLAQTLPGAPEFEIHFHRGILQGRCGNPQSAIASYHRALALRPRHGGVLFNLALTYDRLADYPKALAYYVQSLSAGDPLSAAESAQIRRRVRQLQTHLNSPVAAETAATAGS